MVAFVGEKKESIFKAVSEMYSEVVNHPGRQFHFPTGRPACLFVGYPSEELDAIPETAVESFAGVDYPFAVGAIQQGDRVLDIGSGSGSGSGTDVLIASTLVGSSGKVYGLDMTEAMLSKARANAEKMGASHVEFAKGNAETIPLSDASIDSVTRNGVLNLVPDKPRAFSEIFRVLRPGGRIQIADIVLDKPIRPESRSDPQLWAECIVGAVQEEDHLALVHAAGLKNVTVIGTLDYFSKSSDADTREVAAKYGAKTVVIQGSKAS